MSGLCVFCGNGSREWVGRRVHVEWRDRLKLIGKPPYSLGVGWGWGEGGREMDLYAEVVSPLHACSLQ